MSELAITVTIIATWSIGVFLVWAFIHGAQVLRRQEVSARADVQLI